MDNKGERGRETDEEGSAVPNWMYADRADAAGDGLGLLTQGAAMIEMMNHMKN